MGKARVQSKQGVLKSIFSKHPFIASLAALWFVFPEEVLGGGVLSWVFLIDDAVIWALLALNSRTSATELTGTHTHNGKVYDEYITPGGQRVMRERQ